MHEELLHILTYRSKTLTWVKENEKGFRSAVDQNPLFCRPVELLCLAVWTKNVVDIVHEELVHILTYRSKTLTWVKDNEKGFRSVT